MKKTVSDLNNHSSLELFIWQYHHLELGQSVLENLDLGRLYRFLGVTAEYPATLIHLIYMCRVAFKNEA